MIFQPPLDSFPFNPDIICYFYERTKMLYTELDIFTAYTKYFIVFIVREMV